MPAHSHISPSCWCVASSSAGPLAVMTPLFVRLGLMSSHDYLSPHSLHIQQFGWPLRIDVVPMGPHDPVQPMGIFLAAGFPPLFPCSMSHLCFRMNFCSRQPNSASVQIAFPVNRFLVVINHSRYMHSKWGNGSNTEVQYLPFTNDV